MKNWLRPDFWKLKMKKWIHKLNEINYFNVLDDVFFDAWSDGEIRIAISPILVEADFTAWWSSEVTIFVSACTVLILKNVLEKKSENNQFLLVFYHTKVCEKKKKITSFALINFEDFFFRKKGFCVFFLMKKWSC